MVGGGTMGNGIAQVVAAVRPRGDDRRRGRRGARACAHADRPQPRALRQVRAPVRGGRRRRPRAHLDVDRPRRGGRRGRSRHRDGDRGPRRQARRADEARRGLPRRRRLRLEHVAVPDLGARGGHLACRPRDRLALVQPAADDGPDRGDPRRRDLGRDARDDARARRALRQADRRVPEGHARLHHLAADRDARARGDAHRRGGHRRSRRRRPGLRQGVQPRDGPDRHDGLLRPRHHAARGRQHAPHLRRALPRAPEPARARERRAPRAQVAAPASRATSRRAERARPRDGRARATASRR